LADLDDVELHRSCASDINAFASIPLSDAFRRLPTNTHTFISFSMVILYYDVSVRSESGSLHSSASRRADGWRGCGTQ
jgi:hypothetical protein